MSTSPGKPSLSTATVQIPVAISARHVHLTQKSIDKLFGCGHSLQIRTSLHQPGQFAAVESVALVGPRARIEKVAIVGPPRGDDQVEISTSDAFILGVDAPLRESGDLSSTPGIVIEGPAGQLQLNHGVICALRHIHMSAADAAALDLKDRDRVEVAVHSRDRSLVFGDVIVRVSANFRLELHLDTDEGNAAGLHSGDDGLLTLTEATATLRASERPESDAD